MSLETTIAYGCAAMTVLFYFAEIYMEGIDAVANQEARGTDSDRGRHCDNGLSDRAKHGAARNRRTERVEHCQGGNCRCFTR